MISATVSQRSLLTKTFMDANIGKQTNKQKEKQNGYIRKQINAVKRCHALAVKADFAWASHSWQSSLLTKEYPFVPWMLGGFISWCFWGVLDRHALPSPGSMAVLTPACYSRHPMVTAGGFRSPTEFITEVRKTLSTAKGMAEPGNNCSSFW